MIRIILNIYIFIIIIDTVLSYLPQFKDALWARKIRKIVDYTLAPIRKVLPPDLPFDISPIILILLIKMFEALW